MGSLGISASEAVGDLICRHIQDLEQGPYDVRSDIPFFVADGSKLVEQNERWNSSLSNVQPYYGQCSSLTTNFHSRRY